MFVVAQEQRKHCIFPIDHSSVQRLVYELIPALRETTSPGIHSLSRGYSFQVEASLYLMQPVRTTLCRLCCGLFKLKCIYQKSLMK